MERHAWILSLLLLSCGSERKTVPSTDGDEDAGPDADTDSDTDSDADSDSDTDSDTDEDPCQLCLDAAELALCGCLNRDPGTLHDGADPNIDSVGTLAVLLYDENPDGGGGGGGRRPEPIDIFMVEDADLSDPEAAIYFSFPTVRHPGPLVSQTYFVSAILSEDGTDLDQGLELGDLLLAPNREVDLGDVPLARDFQMSMRLRGFEGEVSLDPDLVYGGDATGPGVVIAYEDIPADGVPAIGFGGIPGEGPGMPPDLSAGPRPYRLMLFSPFFDSGDLWIDAILDDDNSGIEGGLTDGDLHIDPATMATFPEGEYRVELDLVIDSVVTGG